MPEILDPKPTNNRAVATQTNQRVRLESDQPTWNWFVRTNGGAWSQFATGTGVAVWSAPATITEKLTFDRIEIAIGSAGTPDTSTTRHFDLCEGPVAGFWVSDQLRDESLESPPLQPDLWEVDDPPLGLPTLMPGASRQGFGTSHLNRVDAAGGPANLIALFGPGVFVDSAGRLGARTPGAMVRGLGPWPAFVNQYHAGLYFNYDFGKSRTIGVTRILYQDGSSHVAIVRGDGRRNTYRFNGSTWDAAASLGNSLALVSGKFQETTATGRVYHYNAVSSGRATLDRVVDRYGSPAYYDYDVNARLQKVRGPTGSAGLVPYFSYNASGLLSSVVLEDTATPANNRVTYYQYDANRNATRIIGPELCITYFEYNTPELLSAVTDPEGFRWYFAYNSGRAERVLDALSPARASYFSYDAASAVATYKARDAKVTYFQPNAWGEPLRVFNPGTIADYYAYDGDGNLASAKNRLGKQWSYSYDARGNRIAVTDPYSARTYFGYDGQDLLKLAIDPLLRSWYFDYDGNRNLTRQVDPLNKTTYFAYQAVGSMPNAGLLHYRKDRRGNFAYFRFDAKANNDAVVDALGQKTYFEFNSAGERTKVFDARSNAAYFDYDKRGRLTQSKDAYLNTKKWAYDSRCNVTTEVDENARSTYHSYDGNSNRTKTVRAMGGAEYLFTYFRYDEDERLAGQKDARLNETYWTYDGLGRRQKQVNALGDETYWTYDAAHQLERDQQPAQAVGAGRATTYYSYDDAARMRQTIDPGQLLTYHSFDLKGNVLFTNREQGYGRQPWGSSPYGGERATTYMQYDALDRQTRLTDAFGFHSYWEYDVESNLERTLNPRGLAMYYAYDALNRRTHEKDNLVFVSSYMGYDPVGNAVRRIDQKLAETYFTFDKLNRQESTSGPFMPGSSVDAYTYHAYDPASNRLEVRVENPRGQDRRSTYYEYDFANRTTRMIEPEAASGDARGTMLYEYDRVGNQTKVVDQVGRPTYFRFDQVNREDARWNALLETSYLHYDGRGAVTRQVDPEGRTAYFEYDLQGRSFAQANALGEKSYFFYDARGQRTHVANPRGFSTYFQYDLLGRQSKRIHALGGVAYMGYDQAGNQIVSLDELGNPTYFEFDRLNRMVAVRDAVLAKTYFGYDERSSQVLRVDADGRATYMTYDAARRLGRRFFKNPVALEATDSPSYFVYDTLNLKIVDDRLASLGVSYFDHDKLDRLTKKTTIAGAVYYAYDLSGMKTSLKDPDLTENVYVYDSAGRLTKEQLAAGRTAYFAYDRAGLVTRKVLPSNEVVSYYSYDVASRLQQLENKWMAGTPVTLVSYFAYAGRNANGAPTWIRNETGDSTYYQYDRLDRLTDEFRVPTGTGRNYNNYYGYDLVGNRTLKIDKTAAQNVYYTYDTLNLLQKEWNKDAPETTYFTYDASQRMATLKIPGGQSSYFTHDQRAQVKKIEFAKASSPDESREFSYSGDGERLSLKVGTGASEDHRLAWDGLKLLTEKNAATSGTTDRRYRHNMSVLDWIGSVLEGDFGGVLRYFAFDPDGTTRNLLQQVGGEFLQNTWIRDRFGKLVTSAAEFVGNAGKLQFLSSVIADLGLANAQVNLAGPTCVLPRAGVFAVGPANALSGLLIRSDPKDSLSQLPWFARDYVAQRIAEWLFDKWGWTLTAQQGGGPVQGSCTPLAIQVSKGATQTMSAAFPAFPPDRGGGWGLGLRSGIGAAGTVFNFYYLNFAFEATIYTQGNPRMCQHFQYVRIRDIGIVSDNVLNWHVDDPQRLGRAINLWVLPQLAWSQGPGVSYVKWADPPGLPDRSILSFPLEYQVQLKLASFPSTGGPACETGVFGFAGVWQTPSSKAKGASDLPGDTTTWYCPQSMGAGAMPTGGPWTPPVPKPSFKEIYEAGVAADRASPRLPWPD